MITLILFVAGVLALTPLLQRDMRRAAERRRLRQMIGRTNLQRIGASLAGIGVTASMASQLFGSFVRAAADAERSFAKLRAALDIPPGSLVDAQEAASIMAYEQRILSERFLAQAHLGVMLDDWCRSYGWSPSVWRLPLGHSSHRARLDRDLATFRTVKHYELGLELKDPITIHGATS